MSNLLSKISKDCGGQLASCVPLPISDKELIDVVDKARDWALMHGAGMRDRKERNFDVIHFAPFCLLPSPFPRSEFNEALRLQPLLNSLFHRVANDEAFLEATLATVQEVDDFTANLLKVWRKARKVPTPQPYTLAVLRSDVMLDTECGEKKPYCCWKQVEINTIASGFGYLGPASKDLQCYILKQLGHFEKLPNLPENPALWGVCSGLVRAYDLFDVPNASIVFIVDDFNVNICDQRYHEFELAERRPDIAVFRKTLTELYDETTLNEKKQLILDNRPVAVVYYRSGYDPRHYPTCKEWEARLRAEMSSAIKCPSIQYHLAGTKKIQQALAARGGLERFIEDPVQLEEIRQMFTGLYSLDFNEEGEKAMQMAITNPDKYVLKPQREGGGNNLYGEEIKSFLEANSKSQIRAAYILMEKIRPPRVSGYIVRPKSSEPPKLADLVSELGIFGVIIGTKDKIVYNETAGHMLRTKYCTANEGGVEAGVGAMDSPYLVDIC